jgi:hypothetical protein
MSQKLINIGGEPNDGSGDSIRTGFDYTNQNFTETYGNIAITSATTVAMKPFLVPQGGIILWAGTNTNIPTGWVLCDGSNSTPNLPLYGLKPWIMKS